MRPMTQVAAPAPETATGRNVKDMKTCGAVKHQKIIFKVVFALTALIN